MKKITFLLLLNFICFCSVVFSDDTEANKKVKLQDNSDLKPLKPFINECCADIEMDLVPTSDRKSGHMNQDYQKSFFEVPRLQNRLHEDKLEGGYDLVEKSPQSKTRNNNPELHIFDVVPRYNQTQRIVESDERKIVDRILGDSKVFIRKIKVNDSYRIPTTQRINGEGKYGIPIGFLVPSVENPLKDGKLEKGYNWILTSTDMQRMLPEVDFFLNTAPHEPQNSKRTLVEKDLDLVPSFGDSFLDCR